MASENGWSEEDQKKFEREHNTRICRAYRNSHREAYTEYMCNFQKKWRARNPYYYAWKQWNRKHTHNQLTIDEYIQMRIEKENKRRK